MMDKVVLGVFQDEDNAQDAIKRLEDLGLQAKDISVIMRERGSSKVTETTGESIAEGAVTGATTGSVVGGIAGLLIGLGAITIPGGILIGGPVAAALGLTGAAATTFSGALTGALAGGIGGALIGIGIPEADARIYEEAINKNAILLAVPIRNKTDDDGEVKDILEEEGAQQVKTIRDSKLL